MKFKALISMDLYKESEIIVEADNKDDAHDVAYGLLLDNEIEIDWGDMQTGDVYVNSVEAIE